MQPKCFNKSILLTLLLLAPFCSGADNVDSLYKQYTTNILSGDFDERYDQRWVTPEMRQELLIKAREMERSHDASTSIIAKTALIRLGDEDSIKQCINDFEKSTFAGSNFGFPESQYLLPYLIAEIYSAPTNPVYREMSPMDLAVQGAYNILRHYRTFPDEVRTWVKHIRRTIRQGTGPTDPHNQLLRLWWEHNKDAVLSEDYAKATWLPSAKQEADCVAGYKAPNYPDTTDEDIREALQRQRAAQTNGPSQ